MKTMTDSVVAVFPSHDGAESAVRALSAAGLDIKTLSVVGKGYHTEEQVMGFYNADDRITFWGTRGAFWGGLWGLFLGGVFITLPPVGPVIALGYFGAALIAAVESAIVAGGAGAIGAALYSIGIPRDSVISYEAAIKADGFLVMAHGTAQDVARAKDILGTGKPSRLDVHAGGKASPAAAPALVAAHG